MYIYWWNSRGRKARMWGPQTLRRRDRLVHLNLAALQPLRCGLFLGGPGHGLGCREEQSQRLYANLNRILYSGWESVFSQDEYIPSSRYISVPRAQNMVPTSAAAQLGPSLNPSPILESEWSEAGQTTLPALANVAILWHSLCRAWVCSNFFRRRAFESVICYV